MPASVAPRPCAALVIAIDGPSGSGKSSVSREVARRLGVSYLDTGAMYRAICWAAMADGIDLGDEAAVTALARSLDLAVGTDPSDPFVRVGARDVSTQIRQEQVSAAVSQVATQLAVRAELHARQRAIIAAAAEGIVAEGRDITTVVAPQAAVRILLTASEQARLARRALEVHGAQDHASIEATRDQVLRRDADDSTVASFLTAADGVLHLDSSGLTFEQTVQAVLDAVAGTQLAQTTRSTPGSPAVPGHTLDLVGSAADGGAGPAT